MRALYISPHLSATNFGGSLFAATNLQLLREAFAGCVSAASVSRTPDEAAIAIPSTKSKLGTAVANLQGLCGTLTMEGVAQLQILLTSERPSLIWLDTSILGVLIPLIKSIVPEAKIVCAFQNVELDLVRQRIANLQLQYLPALYATWLNERESARRSDLTLALHATDAERIRSIYGRRVDRILPIIVPDREVASGHPMPKPDKREPYILFVGSAFPPNIEALEFLCARVAPLLQRFRIVAVGTGLETAALRLQHSRLEIRGFVDDLTSIYDGAAAVVAPIFSGGGMKVKIAEALMHGKTVIASPFAAVGYESCSESSMQLAETPAEFALHIENLDFQSRNNTSRIDYERFFSRNAGLKHMKEIISLVGH